MKRDKRIISLNAKQKWFDALKIHHLKIEMMHPVEPREMTEEEAAFFQKLSDMQDAKMSRLTPKQIKALAAVYDRAHNLILTTHHCNSKSSSRSVTQLVLKNLPNFWQLFPFILPKKIKDTVYEPAYNDLLRDYCLTKRYKAKSARVWLAFCFVIRTAFMVFDCIRVLLGNKVMGLFAKLIPEAIRNWWLH